MQYNHFQMCENEEIQGWQRYKQALIPTTAPHEDAKLKSICDGRVWHRGGSRFMPLFARWTSDYDCGYETQWWYCIKDTPFDIDLLKSKHRYIIRQGARNFDVHRIDPLAYTDDIYDIVNKAFLKYPKKYRPKWTKEDYIQKIHKEWDGGIVYGAFFAKSGKLCGFSVLKPCGRYINFAVQKVHPNFEKYQINAALINQILTDLKTELSNGCYICDGERNVLHETAFQAYLYKYFGFRKAYCILHVKYRPIMKAAVAVLYPFRRILQKIDVGPKIHNIVSLLKMEEINKSFRHGSKKGSNGF